MNVSNWLLLVITTSQIAAALWGKPEAYHHALPYSGLISWGENFEVFVDFVLFSKF